MTSFSYPLLQVDWRRVLHSLKGYTGPEEKLDAMYRVMPKPALPATDSCPRCEGRLGIYQDTIYQGTWLDCSDCCTRGDPVAFAATFWGIPLREAARRLSRTCTDEQLDVYEKTIQRHEEVLAFWREAQKRILSSSDLRPLRLRLGISPTVQGERWKNYGGQYLGCASREEIDRLVGYRTEWRSIFWQSRGSNPEPQERIKGDLLVLPMQDVPNRISSFLFVRRDSKGREQYVHYRCLAVNHPGGRQRPTPSVFALDLLPRQLRVESRNKSLLVMDPLLAAKLTVKHLEEGQGVPQVMGLWADSPPCTLVQEVEPGRWLTIWAHKADYDVFKHASALNARISLSTASMEDVHKQLSRTKHGPWIFHQIARARPWKSVLEDHLAELPILDAEALLLRLELPPAELRDFLEHCRPAVMQSLKAFYHTHCARRTATVGGQPILEDAGCWWSNLTNDPISNAIVKIETVVVQGKAGQVYCQGTVRRDGKEAAFIEKKAVLASPKGWTWLADLMLKEGLGIHTSGTTRKPSVYLLATAFHTPEVRKAAATAGWNENLPGFSFSGFSIRLGGEIELDKTPWPKSQLLVDAGTGLRRPTGLEDSHIRLLSEGNEAGLAWAAALPVLHNVLADAWGFSPKGVAVTGKAQVAALRLLEGLGCPRTTVDKTLREWTKGFPLIVDCTMGSEARNKWLAEERHNHAVAMSAFHGRLCTVYGGWFRVDGDKPLEAGMDMVEAVRQVVPNYLQDLARRKMQTWSSETSALDRIVKDVADWFARQGGDSKAVWAGDRRICRDGVQDAAFAFAGVLCKFLDDAKLTFERAGFPGKPSRKEAMIYADDTVWIPQIGVQSLLHTARMAPLDISRVSQGLDEAGALVGEKEHRGQPGWLVREEWWNERLHEWRP